MSLFAEIPLSELSASKSSCTRSFLGQGNLPGLKILFSLYFLPLHPQTAGVTCAHPSPDWEKLPGAGSGLWREAVELHILGCLREGFALHPKPGCETVNNRKKERIFLGEDVEFR